MNRCKWRSGTKWRAFPIDNYRETVPVLLADEKQMYLSTNSGVELDCVCEEWFSLQPQDPCNEMNEAKITLHFITLR